MLPRHFLAAAFLGACSLLSFSSLTAYCAKCVKIEQEREKEQKEHPQQSLYYEDYLANLKEKKAASSSSIKKSNEPKNPGKLSEPPLAALENLYNSAAPSESDENRFYDQTQEKFHQLYESDENMIHRDQNLIRDGLDPNENYFGGEASNKQSSDYSRPGQESFLRGKNGNNP